MHSCSFQCIQHIKICLYSNQMRSTGIPELACVDDIDYIRTALVLEEPDVMAERKFLDVIQQCLDLKWTVQLSWIAHNLRHRTSS